MIRFLLAGILTVLPLLFAQAQVQKVLIKGDFYNKPLLEFIQEIEKAHSIQFHYVNDVVKDILLTGVIKHNTPLLDALEILLRDKPVSFAAPHENEIVFFINDKKIVKAQESFYKLSGAVKDKSTGNPLPFVTVYVPGATKGTISNENGHYEIKPLPAGFHLVQFSYMGYSPTAKKIYLDGDVFLDTQLEESALELQELIITPSTFEISTAETPLTLAKEEILHSPNMGKDIYRTLRTLPGIANNDFSAKARIRGGHSDETAVYLDHLLINDPVHLEEVDGTFSIFNTDYIDELSVLTGGFSVKYSDRLSGVVDVKTSDVLEVDKYRASVDLMNMSLFAQKKVSDKLNVFFTVRRGYLDFLLRKMGTEDTDAVFPRFSDAWTKITFQPNSKNALTFNFLAGRDNFQVADMDEVSAHLNIQNTRYNTNGWVNWKWFPSDKFSAITTVAYQSLKRNADFAFSENIRSNNVDKNDTRSFTLTNNSYWNLTNQSNVEVGFELKSFDSRFRYSEIRYDVFNSTPDNIITDDIDINESQDGYTAAAYLQYNWTVRKGLILQPGLRTSTQIFSRAVKWAPRFAISYELSSAFTAKLAWGIYYQPDLYYKLRTSLQQKQPYSKNSKATHYTGSLTYAKAKTNIMLNVYHKDYHYLFDDFRYEFFNRLGGVSILDIPFNTNSGYARGFEIMLRQGYGKNSMLTVSYAYSNSRIRNKNGDETYRDFDQPHVIIINNLFRLPMNWNISLLWTYHTGYPYTPMEVGFVRDRPDENGIIVFYDAGKKNSKRLPDFHSLDLRMEKTWHFKKNALMVYLNVVNFYDRENLRGYSWFPFYYRNRPAIGFDYETQTNIPFFVSPGLSFTLY